METFKIKTEKQLEDLIKIKPYYSNIRFVEEKINGCRTEKYKDIDWLSEYVIVVIDNNTTTLERIKYNFIITIINKISKSFKHETNKI